MDMFDQGIVHIPSVGGHFDDDSIAGLERPLHPGIEAIPSYSLWPQHLLLIRIHACGDHVVLVDIQAKVTSGFEHNNLLSGWETERGPGSSDFGDKASHMQSSLPSPLAQVSQAGGIERVGHTRERAYATMGMSHTHTRPVPTPCPALPYGIWFKRSCSLARREYMPGRCPAAGVHPALLFAPHVLNNPLRYTDPTGHMMAMEGGGGGVSCSVTHTCLTTPPPTCDPCIGPGGDSADLILVGVSSATSLSNNPDFIQGGLEGGCDGCSSENPNAGGSVEAAVSLVSDSLTGLLAYQAMNSQDIPVYANVVTNPDGSVSVPFLTVNNSQTSVTVSVINVVFEVSAYNVPCLLNACVSNGPYGYNVLPQTGIYSSIFLHQE